MKIAVCFFGLPKFFKEISFPSFKENVLYLFQNDDIDFYTHTYNLDVTTNSRNGEKDDKINIDEIHHINLKDYMIENPEEYDKTKDLKYYYKNGNPPSWVIPTSMQFFLRQLNSIKQVWNLVEKSNIRYDLILYSRMDVLYINKLNLDVNNVEDNIYTPQFHKWGGLNDRFALGKYNIMKIYANRFDYDKEFLDNTKNKFHAETFLNYVMKKNDIKNIDINIKFQRIRANKKIHEGDLTL